MTMPRDVRILSAGLMLRSGAECCVSKHGATPFPRDARLRAPQDSALHVQQLFLSELCVLLNELEARFGLGAHQSLDGVRSALSRIFRESDTQQQALRRVHGGFLELRGHH